MKKLQLLLCAALLVETVACTHDRGPSAKSGATEAPSRQVAAKKSAPETAVVRKDVTLKLTGL